MSQSALKRATHTGELTSAILLTARNLFAHTPVQIQDGHGPLTRIAGLTLFQRALLTLQRCGVHQIFVLAGDEVDLLKAALAEGPPITAGIRWIPVREFPPDDPRTWETLAADAAGACIVVGPQAVFSRGLIESMRQTPVVDELVVVVRRLPNELPVRAVHDRLNQRRDEQLTRMADVIRAGEPKTDVATYRAGEILLVPAGGFLRGSPLSELLAKHGGDQQTGETPLGRLVEAAASEHRVRALDASTATPVWSHEVHHEADARTVEQSLYRSLKSNFEGIVDKYINRRLSPLFTRLFLRLKVSPNAVTGVATFIGLVAALCFAQGSYVAGLIGALLFQWSAVIDCCDGEVARLTFTESPFGAKLDLWLDNVVHMAIFAGIGYGAYHNPPPDVLSETFLWAGAITVLANLVSFLGVNILAAHQRKRLPSPWVDFLLKNVATRDFSMVVLLFAVAGWLPWFLMLAAGGSVIFALSTLVLLLTLRPSQA
ncbi:MAG: CDP-alcohol phosphatidyltransferase family protein [Nitrospiraceae bacterium]